MTDGKFERGKIETTFKMLAHRRELEESSVLETELCGWPGYSREHVAKMRADGKVLAF